MVRDKSGKPIVGAIIVLNGGVRVFTVEGGYFHALLAPGNHNIEAVADGYQQQRQEVHGYIPTMYYVGLQCTCFQADGHEWSKSNL